MKNGFSLVELSIVLVILGLLTGGILAGQSLIRAAELRSVSTGYQRYATAIASFRDKYFALPGDMTNAQKFWGVAAACPGTPSTPSTTIATCNGNGDGSLGEWESTNGTNELMRFWQHLANAGLIEGSYTGVPGTTANLYSSIPGTNVPRSKLSSGAWSLYNWGNNFTVSSVDFFEGSYGNLLLFGKAITDSVTTDVVLKPEEMWNIDTKMDDGKPGTGLIRVFEGLTSCHTAGTSAAVALAGTATYNLSNSSAACWFLIPVR